MRRTVVGCIGILCTLGATTLEAQEEAGEPGLGIGSLGVFVGAAAREKAGTGVEFGGKLDFGSLGMRRARMILEAEILRADIDRRDAANAEIDGSFRDFSANVGINFNLIEIGRVLPYVGLGIGIHSLSNNTSHPVADDIYDGALIGAHAALGASFVLGRAGRFGGHAEVRRVGAKDINRTSFRVGASILFGELVNPVAVNER